MAGFSKSSPHVLHRRFDLIIFDWDGTAVPDRFASADRLVRALEPLLEAGAICVVITGTHFENLDRQALHRISLEAKKRLLVCTNRGSETFGFDENGNPKRLFFRTSTEAENRALDGAAAKLQQHVGSYGLRAEIISHRLNRRKIDLIPLPKWLDPKKSEFRELLADVKTRLASVRIPNGLSGLQEAARGFAREQGLSDAKVTSDIKHIEIGLTDKGDAIRWIFEQIVRPRGIKQDRVVFFGDEFGTVGGVPGSDSLMRISEASDCVFISVGAEPEGAPSWVIHIPGGPERFIEFLGDQLELHSESAPLSASPHPDPSWVLEQEGFDPSLERDMESIFALGNGYLGVRGSIDFPIPTSQNDLFIAGVYDKKALLLPYSEIELTADRQREDPYAELAVFPSPFFLTITIDGVRMDLESQRIVAHSRTLDLKNALYFENNRFEDATGRRTRIRSLRCVSLADPHLLLQEIEMAPENHTGIIGVGPFAPDPKLERHFPHLILERTGEKAVTAASGGVSYVVYKTRKSGIGICLASKQKSTTEKLFRLRKFISIFTSRDGTDFVDRAIEHCDSIQEKEFTDCLQEHHRNWQLFWEGAGIEFEKRPELTQAQRFNLYHLRIAADHDPRVSIGAKGLTGRAYEGHVFWDTEVFMFPFYLYSEPDIAKSLLIYRYNTLDGARRRAKALGYQGACFAWESTVTGDDVTPKSVVIKGTQEEIPIFTGSQQIHVTADVAYAVWLYWDATLDKQFLAQYGVELFVETARFWLSRSKLGGDGKVHLRDVVGPDEYHHNVSDNAYTNWMARFNLEKAAWAVAWLEKHDLDLFRQLRSRMALQEGEPEDWKEAGLRMAFPSRTPTGVLEQFNGFFSVREVELSEHDRFRAPISRLFGWREVNGLRVIKQADVLMVPFLFPNAMPREQILANYRYYEPITDHGSSLSACVHAGIAARVGLTEEARKYWERSLQFDLVNAMHNTELGVHAGCMGGTWQALVFHFLGVRLGECGVQVNTDSIAQLPSGCNAVRLRLFYRGKRFPLEIGRAKRRVA